ncbi:MAG: DMT family transporter [Rhodospirillales bacterium]|nr:DMT family transporter [Rhodospirillales bacterium]
MFFKPLFDVFKVGAVVTPRTAIVSSTLAALSVAGFYLLSRFGLKGEFTPADLTFFRFSSALLLAPIFFANNPLTLCGIGWRRGLVLALLGGAALNLLMTGGLTLAPVAHGTVFTQGTMPMFTALLGWILLGDRLTFGRVAGLVLILAGLAVMGWGGFGAAEPGAWRGDLLFLTAGFMWGLFTVAVRAWRIDAVLALSAVAVVNLVIFAPLYFIYFDPVVLRLPISDWAVQAIYQCVFLGIFAAVLYMRAIPVLGAARTALSVAMVPVLATLLAVPLLGEIPAPVEIAGIVIVLFGIAAAVGVKFSILARA